MDFDFGKIKDIFNEIVDYFKNFKASALYKFGDMIVAIVKMIIAIVKSF